MREVAGLNLRTRLYACLISGVGLLVLALSVGSLPRPIPPADLLLMALAAVSGIAVLRLDAAGAQFSFGDTFCLAAVFLLWPSGWRNHGGD